MKKKPYFSFSSIQPVIKKNTNMITCLAKTIATRTKMQAGYFGGAASDKKIATIIGESEDKIVPRTKPLARLVVIETYMSSKYVLMVFGHANAGGLWDVFRADNRTIVYSKSGRVGPATLKKMVADTKKWIKEGVVPEISKKK